MARFGSPTRPRLEGSTTVGSYPAYGEAERAVDMLSDQGFPVDQLAIVGQDLRSVEHVTGRKGYGEAATQSAAQGAFLGFFIGLVVGLFSIVDPLASALGLALYGIVFGAVAGALLGLLTHWLSRGRRDFSSIRTIEADHFDVLATPDVAERARTTLSSPSP